MSIGETIRRLRTARGLTVKALARQASVEYTTIWRIEGGQATPGPRTVRALAAALDVPVTDLMPETTATLVHQVRAGYRPRGYTELGALARGLGTHAKAIRAMSSNTDPFYIGTPFHHQLGQWFADLWSRFAFPRGVHLRRIHYRLLSHGLVWADGKTPYLNTEASFQYLGDASRYARILHLVDADAFEDRRNPPPHIRAAGREPPEPTLTWDGPPAWPLPAIPRHLAWQVAFPLPEFGAEGYDYDPADQPYHLEVWIEKSTMDDVLLPVCRAYGANLVTGVGFQSITSTVKLLQRVAALGKPARIFYISDFDPAGDWMPASVARQIEYWLADYAPDTDIKLTPLALTQAQVVHYRLPRIPTKDTDRRGSRFEERYGEGQVELDALEALYSGVLADLVGAAFAPYYDPTLGPRLAAAAADAETTASTAWQASSGSHESALGTVADEARTILKRYETRLAELDTALQAELAPLRERLAEIREAVEAEAKAFDVDLPERPEPELDEPDEDDWLFASERDYLEQLAVYKTRKAGGQEDDEVA
jgi:transcriptional regulator with XRE-family HTH domain